MHRAAPRRILLLLVAAAVALPLPAQAQLDPSVVCATNAVAAPAQEPRFFCEPLQSVGFIQFDQFIAGLEHLEDQYPAYIENKVIGESLGGLPIYFVEVTNENSPIPREEKLQIGYSASIHANEAAGREGMARVIEDLAAGVGPHGAQLQPLLDQLIVNVWFPNPDSWASGDFFDKQQILGLHNPVDGAGYARTNLNNVDLNREFPNPGLIHKDHSPMSEPEARAVVTELRFSGNHTNLVAGVDLHGMLGSPNMIRSIIPNQDYDFRRMVLAVDMLRTTEERVNADPAFAEWNTLASIDDLVEDALGQDVGVDTGLVAVDLEDPMEWGSRWDMIGYTDTGFTSDYLMLSPRSPTGGMGAVGTITEFAWSHMVPDNKYVAKLTDMHVAGVRQIVRTQMELATRLDTPVMAGTGPVGYAHTDAVTVSSQDDPGRYEAGRPFDLDDPDTWFDFDQVEYDVSNLNFWKDLDRFTADPVTAVPIDGDVALGLDRFQHFVITGGTFDLLTERQRLSLDDWVRDGGHLLVTDSALRYLEGFGATARQVETYLGYSDVQDWSHALVQGVDWGARVTGEGPAIGISVGGPYPQWVLDVPAAGGDGTAADSAWSIAGTTQDAASLGTFQLGEGSINFLGAALPQPRQVTGPNEDHRYGLADYSVSAFTYWIVMNSFGGHIEWMPIDAPFVPTYDFDPIYGTQHHEADTDTDDEDAPGFTVFAIVAGLAAAIILVRRRRQA